MNVVYLSYTGLLEPLGESQVLAYLKQLAGRHRIALISFEKAADLGDEQRMEEMRAVCREHGIEWIPRRYHRRPRAIATAWDIAAFVWTALRAIRRNRVDVVHARGHIPALAALLAKRLSRTPFVFDMRAFWPEELVTSGRLKAGSLMHRRVKAAERACLDEAGAIVVLTHAAEEFLWDRLRVQDRMTVIPTCVDLDRFRPAPRQGGAHTLRVASAGSVMSGWFRLDLLAAFFRAVREATPEAELHVVSREEPAAVANWAREESVERISIYPKPTKEMPATVASFDAVAMFFEPGISKLGSSPTRMGEVLACGVPVVANGAVGDVATIIDRYRVGILVDDASPEAMHAACRRLAELRKDAGLAARCRNAAEEWFSLAKGVSSYDAIYESVGRREARF